MGKHGFEGEPSIFPGLLFILKIQIFCGSRLKDPCGIRVMKEDCINPRMEERPGRKPWVTMDGSE